MSQDARAANREPRAADAVLYQSGDSSHKAKPLVIEKVAVGALLLATFALSLVRMDMVDTPVHLATAREAFVTGHWPVTNTFSYTFPDHPLYQQ